MCVGGAGGVPLPAYQELWRWVRVGGVGVGGEPILIDKKVSNSEKAPGICTGVACKTHKHLSSLNN